MEEVFPQMLRSRIGALLQDGLAVAIVRREDGHVVFQARGRLEAFRHHADALAWIQTLPDVD